MKDFKIYVIIASVLLIGYLVIALNRPRPVVWTPTYAKEDKIPFGTYILYNRLTDIFPGTTVKTYREPVFNVLSDHHEDSATYIIICRGLRLDKYDVEKLIPFIQKGNDVLISSEWLVDTLADKLSVTMNVNYSLHDSVLDRIHFVNKNLDTARKYAVPKEEQADRYFASFDTAKAVSLARNDSNQTTFVKYTFGKGHLFLDSHPSMFTNYNMIAPAGQEYAATILSHLKNSKKTLWDEYYVKGRAGEESPMRVFFASKPLRWAYMITLVGLIVYVLYEMKRRQRIIPVIEPLANSTVGFVSVVGRVYYEQRDNSNLAQKKILYFLEHLRNMYYLKTTKLDREFVEKTSQKTGVDYALVEELVAHINYITGQPVSDHDLIKLNQLIEQFYIKSR